MVIKTIRQAQTNSTASRKVSAAKPKLFRDPVHDLISLEVDEPCEALALELIKTEELQRLRRIRQLGLANLVYHGAEHSRFSHSLGVFHVAKRMLAQLGRHHDIDELERCATLSAALVHDIGHGPFSHAIEKTTRMRHEHVTRELILDPATGVNRVLSRADARLPEMVATLVHPGADAPGSLGADIVSSQLDADRLDYILRDGHATGVRIGVYDMERILSMLEIDNQRLVVNLRAKEAVEGYLIARLHMYKQVYLHKAVRSAELMLVAALARAAELLRSGATLNIPRTSLSELLLRETVGHETFVGLDDADIWSALKAWCFEEDALLSELARGLVHRRLFKTVQLPIELEDRLPEIIDRAREIVASAGGVPRYHLLVDLAEDHPYHPYLPGASSNRRPILVADAGRLQPIEVVSNLARLLGQYPYKVIRFALPARFRPQIEQLVAEFT
jgi:hypothetical protein